MALPLLLAGKQKRMSLGTYPEVTLREARSLRDEARALLAKGVNPRVHRKQKRTAVGLVDLMRQAFAPTLTGCTGCWRRYRPFRSWRSSGMTMPRAALAGRPDFGLIHGVSQSEYFGTWYHAIKADGAELELNALAERTMVLYQPLGAVEPRQNVLVLDTDFVAVLTEIDI